MLVLITACQITAAAGSFFWYALVRGRPEVPTLGASGWILGLIGFGIAYFHTGGPAMRVYRDALIHWWPTFWSLLHHLGSQCPPYRRTSGGLLPAPANPIPAQCVAPYVTPFWLCLILWLITADPGHSIHPTCGI